MHHIPGSSAGPAGRAGNLTVVVSSPPHFPL